MIRMQSCRHNPSTGRTDEHTENVYQYRAGMQHANARQKANRLDNETLVYNGRGILNSSEHQQF